MPKITMSPVVDTPVAYTWDQIRCVEGIYRPIKSVFPDERIVVWATSSNFMQFYVAKNRFEPASDTWKTCTFLRQKNEEITLVFS